MVAEFCSLEFWKETEAVFNKAVQEKYLPAKDLWNTSALYFIGKHPPVLLTVSSGNVVVTGATGKEKADFLYTASDEIMTRIYQGEFGLLQSHFMGIANLRGSIQKALRMTGWLLRWEEAFRRVPVS